MQLVGFQFLHSFYIILLYNFIVQFNMYIIEWDNSIEILMKMF